MEPGNETDCVQKPTDCSVVINPAGAFFSSSGNERCERDRYEFEEFGQQAENIESATKWRACTKNPGHPNFIPIKDFSAEHLPEDCQKKAVVQMVKCASELTVRLRVGEEDPSRPAKWAVARGNKCNGTGTIVGITPASGPCCCGSCIEESHEGNRWWWLHVLTANHVVYSTREARFTQVDLFFDDLESRTDGRMKTCWGVEVVDDYSTGDWSYFRCALHDENVAKRLMLSLKRFKCAERNVRVMPKTTSFWNTVVVVSHPHGMPKKVTVGDLTTLETLNSKRDVIPGPYICSGEIRYTADTCKGSSGALVLWLGIELSHASKSPASKENCIASTILLYCHMLLFYKDYIAWWLIIESISFIVSYVCSLLPQIEIALIIHAVAVHGVTAGSFHWSLMLYSLRGKRTFFSICRGKRAPHSAQFQSHLFRSAPWARYCLTGFDFGSTLLINFLQLLFFLQFLFILYDRDIFVVNCVILATCYVATPILGILFYVLLDAVRHHLLRDTILWPRLVWLGVCFLIISFSTFLNCVVFGHFIFSFPMYLIGIKIGDYTIQLLLSRSCKRLHKLFGELREKVPYLRTLSFGKASLVQQWKQILHLRTVNFIHSCGDEHDNYSNICIGR